MALSLPHWLRKALPYIGIILLFAAITFVYFAPANLEGRGLFQQDIAGASGTAQDVRDFEAATGEHSYWTNSLFGGMPMYQIAPSYPSTRPWMNLEKLYGLRAFLGSLGWLLFALMVGFFIFLKSLRVRNLLAAIGGIMWAFSSYFVILIAAGHIWKLTALAYIPPTIAGLVWIYRGKWLSGGVTMAFFTAMQILANHVQMTYYFLFVMAALVIAWGVEAIRTKKMAHFAKSTAVALIAGLVGVAINATNLYHTYRYAKQTMRGGSELTIPDPTAPQGTSSQANPEGLERDYITQWSYGIGETMTLLVPNVRGGASEPIGSKPARLSKVRPEYREVIAGASAYWGEQPFTSGPVYVGAFVLCLFLLGCFIVKGPVKWALLATTLLSILLSWGKNFMGLTDLFIDYFPLYNNFRAVSSILVIAEFTIPTLAILALVEVIRAPQEVIKNRLALGISLGIPLVICLIYALAPGLLVNFLSHAEQEQLSALVLQNPEYVGLRDALVSVRKSMLQADAWRSLLFIVLSGGILLVYCRGILKALPAFALIGVLSLVDLWMVDKRYLNDGMFRPQREVSAMAAPKTPADETILADKTPGFRVWNQSVNTFNDATTSRWHHSIGGYHAAKLQRYQDLITHQLTPQREGQYDASAINIEVVNMLNTRYVIQPTPQGQPQAILNPNAYGAAWFAQKVEIVPDANSEMQALRKVDLRTTAVVDERFASEVLRSLPAQQTDSTASISIVSYTPKEIVYKTQNKGRALAVCSEIYYPEGWHATIDDKETEILRADYVLRAVIVPSGEHTLRFTFSPRSISTLEAIAWSASILLLLMALLSIVLPIVRRKRAESTPTSLQS